MYIHTASSVSISIAFSIDTRLQEISIRSIWGLASWTPVFFFLSKMQPRLLKHSLFLLIFAYSFAFNSLSYCLYIWTPFTLGCPAALRRSKRGGYSNWCGCIERLRGEWVGLRVAWWRGRLINWRESTRVILYPSVYTVKVPHLN